MSTVKKFSRFHNKSIAVYHGLGGEPATDRIELLKSIGFKNIIYPHINYELEWDLDMCKSLVERELLKTLNVDVVMGFSLGGHLSYILSEKTGKDLVLINPALDRSKTKLRIKYFDAELPSTNPNNDVEVFFGENDNTVPMAPQMEILKNKERITSFIIRGMEHRTPIDKFAEIVQKSNILK